ncbi:MAG TPA: hypothetical protein VGD74_05615 [Vulgatibacter sp.]
MKSRWSFLLFVGIALLAGAPIACSPDDGGGGGGSGGTDDPGCETRADCAEGLICNGGACTTCAGDGDCDRAEVCNPSTVLCEFRENWGDECAEHKDCALGLSCSQGLCLPPELVVECGGRGQCPEGMRCNRPLVVCEQDLGCFKNADCLAGDVCNIGTGQCEPGCTEETETLVCAALQHCADGRCVECESDDECKLGLKCNVAAGRCAGAKTCFTDRDCEKGLICNRNTQSCTEVPDPCFHDGQCRLDEYCDLRRGTCALKECQPDQDAPNGSQDEATSIGQGLRSSLRVCGTEEKWYKLLLQRGDRINVRIESDELAAVGLSAQLRDSSGNVLSSSPFLLDANIGKDGTYFILVRTTDPQSNFALNVLVAKGLPCDPDRFAGNDSARKAAALAPGAYTNLQACPGVPAWFVVDVPTGRTIDGVLGHDPLKGSLDLELFDSDAVRRLAEDKGVTGEKKVSSSAVSGGRAYLLVSSTDGRVQNAYDLTVTLR